MHWGRTRCMYVPNLIGYSIWRTSLHLFRSDFLFDTFSSRIFRSGEQHNAEPGLWGWWRPWVVWWTAPQLAWSQQGEDADHGHGHGHHGHHGHHQRHLRQDPRSLFIWWLAPQSALWRHLTIPKRWNQRRAFSFDHRNICSSSSCFSPFSLDVHSSSLDLHVQRKWLQ